MPQFVAVQSPPTYMLILDQIIDSVYRGELRPGERLPTEEEMAKVFNVSRASVREALASLKLVGLVASRTGYGNYISENAGQTTFMKRVMALIDLLSEQNPLDILEVRSVVEPEAARLAALRRENTDLEQLYSIMEEHKAATSKGQSAIDLDSKFHEMIAASSKNRVIEDMVRQLHNQMKMPSWRTFKERDLEDESKRLLYQKQHQDVLAAIEAQDEHQAQTIMKQHIEAIYKNFLSDQPPQA
ncbi:MAG: FadR family transcriptional regulator [Firmicutes bacterium]|nr:FadR family transcriptional regulator [Bacillota bacterium]